MRPLVFALAAALAAPPPAEPPPAARFPVSGEVVSVTVVVTDRRGRPVRDVRADDFALFVDGRPVPVTVFRAPPSRTRDAPGEPPVPLSPAGGSVSGAEDATTLVVYLDNANLEGPQRARVLRQLQSFLTDRLQQGGTRALVVSAGDRPRLLTPLTTRPEDVASALRAAADEPTRGHVARADARQAIDTVRALLESEMVSCRDIGALQAPVRAYAQARTTDLRQAASAVQALVEGLGTLPGRKAVLHVSGGLEQRPAIDLFHQLGDICPVLREQDFSSLVAPMHDYDLSSVLQALAARASAAGVTLYMVDASGITGLPGTDLSETSRTFQPSVSTYRIREQNLRAGTSILAHETGGTTVFNANDLRKPLAQIADEVDGAYALGFSPDHEPEGRAHRLRVEVRRKGLSVRHPPSYHHAARPDVRAARVLAALLVGLEEDTLGATVTIDAAPAGGPITLRIGLPLDRASTPSPEEPGRSVRVTIALWRTPASGGARRLDVREQVVEIGQTAVAIRVPVDADETELAVGVHDPASQRATYRRLRVQRP